MRAWFDEADVDNDGEREVAESTRWAGEKKPIHTPQPEMIEPLRQIG